MTPLLPHLPSRADLLSDVRRMHELATENRWQDALVVAQRLEAASGPLDVKSPHLAWAENGLADAAAHVGWANHLHATGRDEEALEVARSVTLLNPRCTSALRVMETIALALGREDLAREASLRSKMAAREDPEDGWNHVRWGKA